MSAGAAVVAVVVHHEQPRRCAATVRRLRDQGVPLARVVVVDNGSSLRRSGVQVDADVIETGANLGFGGGANVALRRLLASGERWEWALVLPHDASPEPGCLRRLLEVASARPRAGLASAEYGTDEKPVVDPYFGAMTVACERGDGWEPAGFAHGTFLLLRRACIEEVGLFDESYFAYCEEADLALRAARAGWEVGIVWGAVVSNPHQGTDSAVVDYLMVRNTVALVRRHFGRYRAGVRFVMAPFSGRASVWYDRRARRLALRDVLLGRLGPPPASLTRSRPRAPTVTPARHRV